ncbi:hypothetical protein KUL97_03035 [Synechococcus sp. HK05]|uniref:hypothetical protein n=1 Tax=Synechococcus sp. HK05 TaxID=2725975 RepID=UPI001C37FA20|nr:hypothetical protein [Synechococcus sp. HK05]MBV2350679.1 hypothetical protein [Synechococcus sp. HK05]
MGPSIHTSQSEPLFVEWMRHRQQEQRRHEPVVAQRHATADGSEASNVRAQEVAWAERHAHDRRLHDSAIAQLRHD